MTTATACTADSGADMPSGAGAAHVTVVTTLFPLAWTSEQNAPDAEVHVVGQRGQDPTPPGVSPGRGRAGGGRPRGLHGRGGLQPHIEAAVGCRSGVVVSVLEVAGPTRVGELDRDEPADADRADDADAAPGEHRDGEVGIDPHLWFDAAIMVDVAEAIGAPSGRPRRRPRRCLPGWAAEVAGDLRALDAELDELLAGCRVDEVIVSHEAYDYPLALRGLSQVGISGVGRHSGASPGRIRELAGRIQHKGIPAVLAELLEGRADAEALSRESVAELLKIHPLEDVTEEDYALGYAEMLRRQTQAFATALGFR